MIIHLSCVDVCSVYSSFCNVNAGFSQKVVFTCGGNSVSKLTFVRKLTFIGEGLLLSHSGDILFNGLWRVTV